MDEKIHHYEKKILKIETEENYSYCLAKLYKLPITIRELQNTRVLQSVKRIVKKSANSETGLEAAKLLKRWNAIVVAHDSLKEKEHHKPSENKESHKPSEKKESHKPSGKAESRKSSKKPDQIKDKEQDKSKSNLVSLLERSTYESSWTSNPQDSKPSTSSINALMSNSFSSEDDNLLIETEYFQPDPEIQSVAGERRPEEVQIEDSADLSADLSTEFKSSKSQRDGKSVKEDKHHNANGHSATGKDNTKSRSSSDGGGRPKDDHKDSRKSRDLEHKKDSKSERHNESSSSSSKSKRKNSVKEVDLFEGGPSDRKKSRNDKPKEEKPRKSSKDKPKNEPNLLELTITKAPSLTAEDLQNSVLQSIEQPTPAPYYAIDQASTSFKQFDPLSLMVMKTKPVIKPKENDSELLETMLSNKAKVGKVFSGKKSLVNQHVPTLLRLCQQVLEVNLDYIEYTGGIPYDLLKPVLQKSNADQLLQIEHFNPYLLEETDELWKLLCHQQFRKKEPQEFESWRDVYLRCLDEREAKFRNLTSKISTKKRETVPMRQVKLAFVEPIGSSSSSSYRAPASNVKKCGSFGAAKAKQMEASSQLADVKVKPGGREVPRIRAAPNIAPQLQRKAPLMQKTLMFMKNRFKR